MVKLDWGTKRQCQGCPARFYDLMRSPIICPTCGTVYEVQTSSRRGRARALSEDSKLAALSLEDVVLDTDLDLDEEIGADLGGDDLMEDTSDLEDDIDDMSEVIDHVAEEGDR